MAAQLVGRLVCLSGDIDGGLSTAARRRGRNRIVYGAGHKSTYPGAPEAGSGGDLDAGGSLGWGVDVGDRTGSR